MHPLSTLLALTGFLAHASARNTIDVALGQHGLQFVPNNIIVNVGDYVRFNFYNVHSVVQSRFESPCQPLNGGMYSGIISSCLDCGAATQRFVHEVEDGEPIWFYCSLRGHCQSGMVGVINAPPNKTLAAYTALAKNTDPDASQSILNPNASSPVDGTFMNVTSSVLASGSSAAVSDRNGAAAASAAVSFGTPEVSFASDVTTYTSNPAASEFFATYTSYPSPPSSTPTPIPSTSISTPPTPLPSTKSTSGASKLGFGTLRNTTSQQTGGEGRLKEVIVFVATAGVLCTLVVVALAGGEGR